MIIGDEQNMYTIHGNIVFMTIYGNGSKLIFYSHVVAISTRNATDNYRNIIWITEYMDMI